MSEDEQIFIKEFDQPIPANIEKIQRHLGGVTQEKRNQKFLFIRTMEITCSSVALWHDLGLVTNNEYLDYVSGLG